MSKIAKAVKYANELTEGSNGSIIIKCGEEGFNIVAGLNDDNGQYILVRDKVGYDEKKLLKHAVFTTFQALSTSSLYRRGVCS